MHNVNGYNVGIGDSKATTNVIALWLTNSARQTVTFTIVRTCIVRSYIYVVTLYSYTVTYILTNYIWNYNILDNHTYHDLSDSIR